jgi:hypothetical protein
MYPIGLIDFIDKKGLKVENTYFDDKLMVLVL